MMNFQGVHQIQLTVIQKIQIVVQIAIRLHKHMTTKITGVNSDEVELPAGVPDTMLTAPDFVTDECHCILNIAPGEGNRPIKYI